MKAAKVMLKILISPVLLAFGIVYLLCSLISAVSSVVTNLVGTVFLAGAVCGWIVHAQESMVWSVSICGVVILLLPLAVKAIAEILLRFYGLFLRIIAW